MRQRHREQLSFACARRLGPVEDELHRRAEGGGERLVEDGPVVVDVKVDDRARAEAVDLEAGYELCRRVMRDRNDDRAFREELVELVHRAREEHAAAAM